MPYIGQSLTEGTRREYSYVATASQTTFNAIYTVGAVDVYQNGVLLAPSDYTATTGTTVVFNTGAALNDEITIHCHNTFSVADTVSASQGGTFSGAVTHTGAFTSRGIDDNAASTAMTLDASGNVLVGTTTTTFSDDGVRLWNYGSIDVVRASYPLIYLNRKTTDGDIVVFNKDGTTVGSIASKDGDLAIGTGTIGIRFLDGSSAIVPQNHSTNSGTDGLLDIGVGAARFKDLYLSGGVYLGGTGAANKLDDYEEGTCSIVMTDSLGNQATMGYNVFKYTKVGNLVFLTGTLEWTSTSAMDTSRIRFYGLPFASSSNPSGGFYRATVSFGSSSNGAFLITRQEIAGGIDPSQTFVWGTHVTANNLDGALSKTSLGTSGTLYGMSMTYQTDA